MPYDLDFGDGKGIVRLYDQEEVDEFIEDFSSNFDAIHWLSDEDYAKAIGQFRLAVGAIVGEMMKPLRMYGQEPFVDNAVIEIVKITAKLAEDFGLRVRGIDNIISLEIIKAKEREKQSRLNGVIK